jgi:glycine cleavage system regulatory protein
MQTSLVLTILGNDNQGLVKGLSVVLNEHNASWEESRMVHLAGKFAGLLQVSLPVDQLEPLKKALKTLEKKGLSVVTEHVQATIEPTNHMLTLEVLGQDRPGIIHDITHQLADLHINIEKLESELRIAPMSAEHLFYAQLTLGLPDGVSAENVQDTLEAMSDQLMVDFNFES